MTKCVNYQYAPDLRLRRGGVAIFLYAMLAGHPANILVSFRPFWTMVRGNNDGMTAKGEAVFVGNMPFCPDN
jgi:hypothetical protein